MSIQTVNPFTNTLVKSFDEISDADLDNLSSTIRQKNFNLGKKLPMNIAANYCIK